MVVLSPAEDVEARACVKASYAHKGPVYMRFGRIETPVFHDENYHLELGKCEQLTEETDIAIISTGIMTYEALCAAKDLEKSGIHARVINVCSIKPLDEAMIHKAAIECGRILTVEEHNVIGGLGEAVAAVVCEHYPVPVQKLGIQDVFGISGAAWELLEIYHLTAADIVKHAKGIVLQK